MVRFHAAAVHADLIIFGNDNPEALFSFREALVCSEAVFKRAGLFLKEKRL